MAADRGNGWLCQCHQQLGEIGPTALAAARAAAMDLQSDCTDHDPHGQFLPLLVPTQMLCVVGKQGQGSSWGRRAGGGGRRLTAQHPHAGAKRPRNGKIRSLTQRPATELGQPSPARCSGWQTCAAAWLACLKPSRVHPYHVQMSTWNCVWQCAKHSVRSWRSRQGSETRSAFVTCAFRASV